MWPDPRVARFVEENFVAARVHVKDDGALFQKYSEKYGAQWTPTILELDPEGEERHRVEGFLPADDLLPQLMLGRAQIALAEEQWDDAERRFREIVDKFPESDAAPEALYWAGVSDYRATEDPSALRDTQRAFRDRYSQSSWARKASVWEQ